MVFEGTKAAAELNQLRATSPAQPVDHSSALGRIAQLEDRLSAIDKGLSAWIEKTEQRLANLERELGLPPHPQATR